MNEELQDVKLGISLFIVLEEGGGLEDLFEGGVGSGEGVQEGGVGVGCVQL